MFPKPEGIWQCNVFGGFPRFIERNHYYFWSDFLENVKGFPAKESTRFRRQFTSILTENRVLNSEQISARLLHRNLPQILNFRILTWFRPIFAIKSKSKASPPNSLTRFQRWNHVEIWSLSWFRTHWYSTYKSSRILYSMKTFSSKLDVEIWSIFGRIVGINVEIRSKFFWSDVMKRFKYPSGSQHHQRVEVQPCWSDRLSFDWKPTSKSSRFLVDRK